MLLAACGADLETKILVQGEFKIRLSPDIYVVNVVLTNTRIIKSVVAGQAPVTLEWRNTPGKTHTNTQKKTRTYSHVLVAAR